MFVADAMDCSHWFVSMGAIIGQIAHVSLTYPGLDLHVDNITEADLISNILWNHMKPVCNFYKS